MAFRTVAIRLSSSFLGFAVAGVLAAGVATRPAQAATTTYNFSNSNYSGGAINPGDTVLLNDGALFTGNVTDNGTLQFNFSAGQVLNVSSTISGTGTLALTNSGTLNLSGTTVANATIVLDMATSVSAGLLQIRSGIGSLRIGSSGTGTLNVTGGSVTGLEGFLGYNAGSIGLAGVSSGTWATTTNLTVGRSGTGMLDVSGGRVTSNFANIGGQSGGFGTVTVSSGTLSMSSFLNLGRSGTGRLEVTGGLLTNFSGTIGLAAGGLGTATVSDGTWYNGGDLVVGASGTGKLTMTGGLVTVGGILSKGSAGTINLNSGGTLQIGAGSTGGVLNLDSLVNNGTLIFNRSDASTYSGDLSGSGAVAKQGAGQLTLAGANSYSSLTTISAGTVALSGAGSIGTGGLNLGTTGSPGVFDLLGLTASSYSLPSSAALAGVGTIAGNGKSLAVLGSLAPGNSAGTITVGTGLSLDLSNSGTSLFEITSPAFTAGTFDLVSGDGSVVFGGILNLAFSGGTYADGTDVLQIFATTGGRSGNFSAVNATGLAAGQSATFNAATGTISVVPEPSTYVIAGLSSVGLAGMMRWRKRRAAKSGTGATC
jgi:autotransporter-associated beta strand protein/T5SS/PEP-CTERM-associated repeat protein